MPVDLRGVSLAHLAQHSKPLGLLNVGDFFAPLLRLLTHLQQAGFASVDVVQRYLVVDPDPLRLVWRLLTHPRWPEASPTREASSGERVPPQMRSRNLDDPLTWAKGNA